MKLPSLIAAILAGTVLLGTTGTAQNRLFSDCSCSCVGGRMRHVGCDASERMRLLCPARPCDEGSLRNLEGPAPLGCEWRSIPNEVTGELEMQRVCEDAEEAQSPAGADEPLADESDNKTIAEGYADD